MFTCKHHWRHLLFLSLTANGEEFCRRPLPVFDNVGIVDVFGGPGRREFLTCFDSDQCAGAPLPTYLKQSGRNM